MIAFVVCRRVFHAGGEVTLVEGMLGLILKCDRNGGGGQWCS